MKTIYHAEENYKEGNYYEACREIWLDENDDGKLEARIGLNGNEALEFSFSDRKMVNEFYKRIGEWLNSNQES